MQVDRISTKRSSSKIYIPRFSYSIIKPNNPVIKMGYTIQGKQEAKNTKVFSNQFVACSAVDLNLMQQMFFLCHCKTSQMTKDIFYMGVGVPSPTSMFLLFKIRRHMDGGVSRAFSIFFLIPSCIIFAKVAFTFCLWIFY